MQKPAPVEYPVLDLIRDRWSPRAFADKLVPADVLRSLFEAARWSPSSSNEQPWVYFVATRDDQENFANLLSILVEANSLWAKDAPVLALALAELSFASSKSPNRNAQYDVGAASAYLTMEATSRGLQVHQMGGYNADKAREVLGIPEGWQPIAALTIGYPGDPTSLPDKLRERELLPRKRKPIREFVMAGVWGHTSPIVSM
jgi:nitroreductase